MGPLITFLFTFTSLITSLPSSQFISLIKFPINYLINLLSPSIWVSTKTPRSH